MTFTTEQVGWLQAKLDPSHVAERTQAGRKLSYIEGWWAISEANRIFGFDGWHRETVDLQETHRALTTVPGYGGKPDYEQWRVSFIARVRVTVGEIVREGTGYGSGMAKPEALGDAIESAVKEAETDAMKRAFMTFGNPFGLALYDKTQANVGVSADNDRPASSTPNTVTGPAIEKRTSSASLKRADVWAEMTGEINECTTVKQVLELRTAWSRRALKEKWPANWLDAAAEEFDKGEAEVKRMIEREADADTFPGDLPANGNSYVNNVMAGE